MRKRTSDEKGFTLIEVIITLVLVGITAALAGMWIVSVVNGYVFAKMNANAVQKGQLAMTRLAKEFIAIKSVSSDAGNTNGTKITYTRTDSLLITTPDYTASRTGNGPLLLNGNILTDSVSGFTLQYCDNATSCAAIGSTWSPTSRIIQITLTLMGANDTPVTFVQRVAPRNL